jgi:Ca2+-binding RTX toxin-like protein
MPVNFWDEEFPVNVARLGTKDFSNHAASVLPDGRIIVVWGSSHDGGDGDPSGFGHGIRARILNQDGSPAGAEFVVNSTTINEQYSANVAVLTDGRFVVTWISNDPGDGGTTTNDTCVRARVFNADGSPATYDGSSNDFVVNAAPGVHEANPAVTALADGGFVIAFQGPVREEYFDPHSISTRRFTSTGPASATQEVINVGNHNDAPSIITLADGRYVVAWHQSFADEGAPPGVGGGLRARIYLANGSPDPAVNGGNAIILDYFNLGDQRNVELATLADGRFVATWVTDDATQDGSSTAIRARVFLANGTPDLSVASGQDFLVNTYTLYDQQRPVVTGLADGGFVISYWSHSDLAGDPEDTLVAQAYDADGVPVGGNFLLNEGPGISFGNYSGAPHSMALMPDGRLFTFYHNEPGYEYMMGRFLDFSETGGTRNGTSGANTLVGTAFADTLNGLGNNDKLYAGGGNDVLDGGAGNDTMSGGSGNDSYYVNSAGDVIVEGVGRGTADTVATNVTFTLTAGAEVELLRTTSNGGTTALDLTGNAYAQTIVGNAGVNILSDGGKGGADTLNGLGGNDLYRVYNTADVIVETSTTDAADRVMAAVHYSLGTGVRVEQLTTNGSSGTSGIYLVGNEFAQEITGNAGNNRLEGKGGHDILRGLGGNDTFAFASTLGAANVDTILDFNVSDDRFLLSDSVFKALTPGTLSATAFRANTTGLAEDADDRIVYESDTGNVYYDANGSASGGSVLFAKVTIGLALTNADFSVV